jgi:rod shape-determining protein MreD
VVIPPWERKALKVALVLVAGILAQTTFGPDLRADGVAPDFMMLLTVCAGFASGPDQGAVVGFAAGGLSDLFLQDTPFGLSALAGCLVGFAVGWGRSNMLSTRLLLAPFMAAAGTAVGVALFVVIGYIVGQQQLVAPGKRWLVEVAFIEACYSGIFSLPATWLMSWALEVRVPVASPEAVPGAAPPEPAARRRPGTARSRRRRRIRAGVR